MQMRDRMRYVEGSTASAGQDWYSQVAFAMQARDIEYFQSLLEERKKGQDINEVALLYMAAEKGYTQLYRLLIMNGVNINGEYERFTPLCGAAIGGRLGLIRQMLKDGAMVDGGRNTVSTPLMQAVRHYHLDAVRCLVEHGADVNRYHHWSGETPLDMALDYNHQAAADYLRKRGALSSYEMPPGATEREKPLIQAVLKNSRRVQPFPYEECPELGYRIWIATEQASPRRYLFTAGLADKVGRELISRLPDRWRFPDIYGGDPCFSDRLYVFAKQAIQGMSLDKRQTFYPKRDYPYWPTGVMAMCAPNPSRSLVLSEDSPRFPLCEVQLKYL